ncbi:unnamed protein product [Brassica rapa]|nr:unnamed protein product [Brassica napus]CAG7901541.1 unnamed protein product [Brassica rapa]
MEPQQRSQRRRNNITGMHQIGQTESKSDNRSHRTRPKAKMLEDAKTLPERRKKQSKVGTEGDSTEEVEKAEDDTVRENPEVKPSSSPKLQSETSEPSASGHREKDAPPEPSASGHRRDRYAVRGKTRQPILREPSSCQK